MTSIKYLEGVKLTLTDPSAQQQGYWGHGGLAPVYRRHGPSQRYGPSKTLLHEWSQKPQDFVLGAKDVCTFWSETFEHHALLESFALPNYAGLHGCTKCVSEWPFLRAALDSIFDKCRVPSLSTWLHASLLQNDVITWFLNEVEDENGVGGGWSLSLGKLHK